MPASEDASRSASRKWSPKTGRCRRHSSERTLLRGITSGISAADRARTIRVLANPRAIPDDLKKPGHIFRSAPSREEFCNVPATESRRRSR
ncbi:MAG: 3,4-dihydroxy-2-butanone-4-phosphate synthase [Verrucomicrobiota bacterium]